MVDAFEDGAVVEEVWDIGFVGGREGRGGFETDCGEEGGVVEEVS